MTLPKLSKPIEYGITAAALLPGVYWMITESGPYRWLLALEQEKFGWSSDRLTLAAIVLAIYLPLRTFFTWRATSVTAAGASAEEGSVRPAESARTTGLIAFAIFACLLLLGGVVYARTLAMGKPSMVTAGDFAIGKVKPDSMIELDAKTKRSALSMTKGGRKSFYIPLAEAAVVVLVEADKKEQAWSDDRLHVTGFATKGIDNTLRDQLASVGIGVGADAWLVNTTRDPNSERWIALALTIFGAVLAPVVYVLRRRAYGAPS